MTLELLRDALIVSCQAPPGSPLRAPAHMAAMAEAAMAGGARGIRAEGAADIEAITRAVELPVIGLRKLTLPGTDVYITPTLESASEVVAAGAAVLAVDATLRPRHDGSPPDAFIRRLNGELGVPVLADVDTLEAGVRAREAGAAAVATTLSGYTGPDAPPEGPDLELLAALAARLDCPVRGRRPLRVARTGARRLRGGRVRGGRRHGDHQPRGAHAALRGGSTDRRPRSGA